MATVKQILQTDFNSTFSFRATGKSPLPENINFARGSEAREFDENRDIIDVSSGEPRYRGVGQPLRIEGQRTQEIPHPRDFTSWTKSSVSVTKSAGQAKGRSFDRVTENTTDGSHRLGEFSMHTPRGEDFVVWMLARPNGRNWMLIRFDVRDSNSNNSRNGVWFNIQDGTIGSSQSSSEMSYLDQRIEPLGGGWMFASVVVSPDPDYRLESVFCTLANGDGVLSYNGDGTSGIDLLAAQATAGKYPTSPIFDGIGTRNKDYFVVEGSKFASDEAGTYLFELEVPSNNIIKNEHLFSFQDSNDRVFINNVQPPYRIKFFDLSVGSVIANAGDIYGYQKAKVAMSFDQNQILLACNGNVTQGDRYDGSSLTDDFEVAKNQFPLNLYSVSYEPQVKSTTDLEILTNFT